MNALQRLAYEKEHAAAIVAAGGVAPLVSNNAEGVQGYAAAALLQLVCRCGEETAALMAGASAAKPLVACLNSQWEWAQVQGAAVLAAMAADSITSGALGTIESLMDAGAIVPLVRCLSSPSQEVQAQAAVALRVLLEEGGEKRGSAVAAAGGVVPLISCLSSTSVQVQSAAATALSNFAACSTSCAEQAAAAGAIDPMVVILSGADTSDELRGAAAWALGALAASDKLADPRALLQLQARSPC